MAHKPGTFGVQWMQSYIITSPCRGAVINNGSMRPREAKLEESFQLQHDQNMGTGQKNTLRAYLSFPHNAGSRSQLDIAVMGHYHAAPGL